MGAAADDEPRAFDTARSPLPAGAVAFEALRDGGGERAAGELAAMADSTAASVAHELAARVGAPCYWCVLAAPPPPGHVDAVLAAHGGRVRPAARALLGPGAPASLGVAGLRQRALGGAYVCPYLAGCGHPCSLPAAAPPAALSGLLEQAAPGGGRVAVVADAGAPAAFASPPGQRDASDAAARQVLGAEPRASCEHVGECRVSVRHELGGGGGVQTKGLASLEAGLEAAFASLQLARAAAPEGGGEPLPGATAAVLQRRDGTQATRVLRAAAEAGQVAEATLTALALRHLRASEPALAVLVEVPGCDGPARVTLAPGLAATATLRSRRPLAPLLRSALEFPALRAALAEAYDVPPLALAGGGLDAGTPRLASRHLLVAAAPRQPSMAAVLAALDRWPSLLPYTRTDDGAEVTLARVPGYEPPTPAAAFLARRRPELATRRAQVQAELQAALGQSAAQAATEVAAYIERDTRLRVRGVRLPPGQVVATVSASTAGVAVAVAAACPVRYVRRLLWLLRVCLELRPAPAPGAGAAAPRSVQDVLRELGGAAAAADSAPAVPGSYVLNRLRAADPELFAYDGAPGFPAYSKVCGAVDGRQPIVLSARRHAELAADGAAPAAAVHSARGDAYVCPEVWCPGLEVAMTAEQYRAAGERCADGGSGLKLSAARYWAGGTSRHPGFLGPEKHPAGLCMPCCFKRPQAAAADARRAGYVHGAATSPLPDGRLGLPPPGTALDGAALRAGVPQAAAFLESVAYAKREPLRAVRARLCAAATVGALLRVGGGALLQRFVDVRGAPRRAREFRAHLQTAAGADQLAATGTDPAALASPASAAFLREVALFDAAERWREHVRSDGAGHAFILPLLPAAYPGSLTAVLEALGGEPPELLVHTPLGCGGVAADVAEVQLVLKSGSVYEPLLALPARRSGVPVHSELGAAAAAAHWRAARAAAGRPLARLHAALRSRRLKVAAHVLTADLLVAGAVVAPGGPFVPLPAPEPLGGAAGPAPRLVHYAALHAEPAAVGVGLDAAEALLSGLATELGWPALAAAGRERLSSGGRVLALRVAAVEHGVVPVAAAPALAEHFAGARDAGLQFARAPADPAHPVQRRALRDAALQRAADAMRLHLRDEHLQEMWVLNHRLCPYPRAVRAARLMELTSPVHGAAAAAVNRILTRNHGRHRPPARAAEEIVANEDDLLDGNLAAAVAAAAAGGDVVDVVRLALAAHAPARPLAGFAAGGGPAPGEAWAAPARGLAFVHAGAPAGRSLVPALAAIASAVAAAEGPAAASALDEARHTEQVCRDVVAAAERGGAPAVRALCLHARVLSAALAELDAAAARQGALLARLRRRLAASAAPLAVGPGDAARALAGPTAAVLVLHPGGAVLEGSGAAAASAVVLLRPAGGLAVAVRGDGAVLRPAHELPAAVRALLTPAA